MRERISQLLLFVSFFIKEWTAEYREYWKISVVVVVFVVVVVVN